MSADEILFSPIFNWRKQCTELASYVEAHRGSDRNVYAVDRTRPSGALYLIDLLFAFWENGQRLFWRVENQNIFQFEFEGKLAAVNAEIPFPAFGEIGHAGYWRSIEDVNLVPNTYTSYFIFANENDALAAVVFISSQFP